jgi:orotate phosphoribosyltransferase
MTVAAQHFNQLSEYERTRQVLLAELQQHALIKERVQLSSGQMADYLVDAKRAILQPSGFAALKAQVAHYVEEMGATAVGGLAIGADPIACAALDAGVKAFFVRKQPKAHGLRRQIEGPELSEDDQCLVVDDVVTTGGSTVRAIEVLRAERLKVCGVLAICDRLAGGREAIERAAGAPFVALTTIDEVYPDRPDRV